MDRRAVLAAFDKQIRQRPETDAPDQRVERDGGVVRSISDGDGWSGVTWCAVDDVSADAVIAAQISRFAEMSRPWEWKHYSYDQPPDLPDRLLAAGFTREPAEALLVAEVADLRFDVPPPPGVELRVVIDEQGVDALVSVHNEVFGEDHSALGRTLLADLGHRPTKTAAVVASVGQIPVAAGRVEFHSGTDFASLWGGGTLTAWRGRGVFRSLVAHRAALAAARGFRYLQVDASADSRPILQRRTRYHDPIHARQRRPLASDLSRGRAPRRRPLTDRGRADLPARRPRMPPRAARVRPHRPCGCWPKEGAVVRALPEVASRATRPESQRTAA